MGLVTATSRRGLISVATVIEDAIRVGCTVTKRWASAGSPERASRISNQSAGDSFHSQAPIPATSTTTHAVATVRTIRIRRSTVPSSRLRSSRLTYAPRSSSCLDARSRASSISLALSRAISEMSLNTATTPKRMRSPVVEVSYRYEVATDRGTLRPLTETFATPWWPIESSYIADSTRSLNSSKASSPRNTSAKGR